MAQAFIDSRLLKFTLALLASVFVGPVSRSEEIRDPQFFFLNELKVSCLAGSNECIKQGKIRCASGESEINECTEQYGSAWLVKCKCVPLTRD